MSTTTLQDLYERVAVQLELAAADGKIPHHNPYGYNPTLWVCALFVGLYGLSTLVHLIQALRWKTWYMIPSVVLGGCGEVLGWSGRLWSAKNVTNHTGFLIQISTTIIAPTFLACANFIILGLIVERLGPQYSRLSPKMYAWIFTSIDVAALVVQAVGGGLASVESDQVDGDPDKGGNIMLAGIIIQLVEIFIYSVLGIEFFSNYSRNKVVRRHAPGPRYNAIGTQLSSETADDVELRAVDKTKASEPDQLGGKGTFTAKLRLMAYALAFSSLLLLIRAVYRVVELSDGWNGTVIKTQVYFVVLDGLMIVMSMFTLNILHPGYLLK